MSKAVITNALLRCTRGDRLADEVFDLVREDLGLWILELPDDFQEITKILSDKQLFLKSLSEGGSDYTLHIAASIDGTHSLAIPPELVELSASCGFLIEVSGSV